MFLDILESGAFWFGLCIIAVSQLSKFSEFSDERANTSISSSLKLKLSTKDFVPQISYNFGLAAYIIISAVIYLLLCSVSAPILVGWLKINGALEIKESLLDSAGARYLFVCAALIGVTQPIPKLEKVSDLQKKVIHALIGVPERVLEAASRIVNGIFTRVGDDADPNDAYVREIDRLLSDDFLEAIDKFADVRRYSQTIDELELREIDQHDFAHSGTIREKRNILKALVFAATLASARKSGRKGLHALADVLDVEIEIEDDPKSLLGNALVVAFIGGLICFSIPFFFSPDKSNLWPQDLPASAGYVFANYLPICLAALYVSQWQLPRDADADRNPSLLRMIRKNAISLLFIILFVVLLDFSQALFDTADRDSYKFGLKVFILSRLHLFIFHGAIVALSVLLFYKLLNTFVPRSLMYWIRMIVFSAIIGILSAFYAVVNLKYRLVRPVEWDYMSLVSSLNLCAFLICAVCICATLNQQNRRASE